MVARRALHPIRVRVDASKCDGQGVCKLTAPEFFELDRYGHAYVHEGAGIVDPADHELFELAREAEATCPRAAILLERVAELPDVDAIEAPPPSAPASPPAGGAPRLLLGAGQSAETLDSWRAAGGSRGGLRRAVRRGAGGRDQGPGRRRVPGRAEVGGAPARRDARGERRRARAGDGQGRLPPDRSALHRPRRALATAHDRGIERVLVAIPEGEPGLRAQFEDQCYLRMAGR